MKPLLLLLLLGTFAYSKTKPNILFIFADDWGWGILVVMVTRM